MALVVKSLPANAGDIRDAGSILGSGRFPGRGHGNPLQYSCLENPHGWRGLVGYGAWHLKELDTTEHTQVRIRNSHQGRRQAEGSWWCRRPPPVSSPALPPGAMLASECDLPVPGLPVPHLPGLPVPHPCAWQLLSLGIEEEGPETREEGSPQAEEEMISREKPTQPGCFRSPRPAVRPGLFSLHAASSL